MKANDKDCSEEADLLLGVLLSPELELRELSSTHAENFLEDAIFKVVLLLLRVDTLREARLKRVQVELVFLRVQVLAVDICNRRGLRNLLFLDPSGAILFAPLREQTSEVEWLVAGLNEADLDFLGVTAVGQRVLVLFSALN